ncbi:hypothetical protein EGX25_15445, partial [Listeria monocytogenes]|nr:hypothetical protein [Listeria monocytogenes]EAG1717881.1 hypothetical protein [Listeria monocytogenes]
LFIKFFSFKEGKDLSQKTLTPLIECMSSKKRDYTKFTELASSNVRNAISHGGVKIEDKMIIFSYREKSETLTTEMSFFDFKDSLFQLFDAISASLLAFFYFLIKKNITFANIISTKNITVDTKKFFEKNCLSSLQINCIQIDEVAVQIQKNKIQYNIELITPDLSENTRLEIGIYIAKCFCQLRDIKPIDAIMISFKSPKTVNSFFRIESSIIEKWNSGLIGLSEVKACINASGDILMCPINEESRNEFEDSFRYYSDIENRDFYLAEIEDISIEGVKRFRAVLYLKHATRKSHVKQITNSAVNILKKIENYGFTTNKVKHGNMEADILYISIYRREVRNRKNRTLLPSNDNFVVQVQYDKDKLFPIRNTYIDRYLKIRKEQEIEYSWNPNF